MRKPRALPNPDSWNDWLLSFDLGERRYIETTLDYYPSTMRIVNTPKSRRPEIMANLEFSSSLFTAVSAGNVGDIRYLVCIERVK